MRPSPAAASAAGRSSRSKPTAPTVGSARRPASLIGGADYYAAYRVETDAHIERSRRETDEAHSAFLAARQALAP